MNILNMKIYCKWIHSFVNTFIPDDNPIFLWSMFFSSFLFNFIFSASFLLESFRMTLPLLPFSFRRFHDSMFSVRTSASIPHNIPWILSSRALSITDSGMPKISRHSVLEYCSLAQHFHSVTTKRSINFTFTFQDIARVI